MALWTLCHLWYSLPVEEAQQRGRLNKERHLCSKFFLNVHRVMMITYGLSRYLLPFSLKPLVENMHKSLFWGRHCSLLVVDTGHNLWECSWQLNYVKKIKAFLMLSSFSINVVKRFMPLLMAKCKCKNLSWPLVMLVNS